MYRTLCAIMLSLNTISSLHSLQLIKTVCAKRTANIVISAARMSNFCENKFVSQAQKLQQAAFAPLAYEKDPFKAKAYTLHYAMLKAIATMDEEGLKKTVNDESFMHLIKPGVKTANIAVILITIPFVMRPLQYAVAMYLHTGDARCIPIIQLLLDVKANPQHHMTDSRYTCRGDFVLHAILLLPHDPKDIIKLIEIFLKAGVPVDCRSVAEGREGQTPLMRAIQLRQHQSVIDALLAARADATLKDYFGRGVVDYYRLAEE